MNKLYLHAAFISFRIWLLSALLNGIASLITLCYAFNFIRHGEKIIKISSQIVGSSLIFSTPSIFLFWLCFSYWYNKENLFRWLFVTGMLLTLLSGLLFSAIVFSMSPILLLLTMLNFIIAIATQYKVISKIYYEE